MWYQAPLILSGSDDPAALSIGRLASSCNIHYSQLRALIPLTTYRIILIRGISIMLIQESHVDVSTTADGPGTMRKYTTLFTGYPHHISNIKDKFSNSTLSPSISPPDDGINFNILSGIYVYHPTIPGYPNARFPGVVVFSEIYQGGMSSSSVRRRHQAKPVPRDEN